MANVKDDLKLSKKVAADYSTSQYYLMNINTSDQWVKASTAGQKVVGVLIDAPDAANEFGCCRVLGPAKVIAGGTVAQGDRLVCDANGKAVKVSASDQYVFGRAIADAVTGDIFEVIITHEGKSAPIYFNLHYQLEAIADGDLMTTFTPGFAGTIEAFYAVVTEAASTASKLSTINLEIGTTNLTGGAISLTTAACSTKGAVVAASAITAANTFGSTDTISMEASSTTAFVEGEVSFVIKMVQTN